uniref:Uncharacterized protein n=1 Tax=Trichogramma kaykai TaxID=54128 RepID=A0ABD2XAD4_9HYME
MSGRSRAQTFRYRKVKRKKISTISAILFASKTVYKRYVRWYYWPIAAWSDAQCLSCDTHIKHFTAAPARARELGIIILAVRVRVHPILFYICPRAIMHTLYVYQ